jgi:hypothetical protein
MRRNNGYAQDFGRGTEILPWNYSILSQNLPERTDEKYMEK